MRRATKPRTKVLDLIISNLVTTILPRALVTSLLHGEALELEPWRHAPLCDDEHAKLPISTHTNKITALALIHIHPARCCNCSAARSDSPMWEALEGHVS